MRLEKLRFESYLARRLKEEAIRMDGLKDLCLSHDHSSAYIIGLTEDGSLGSD